MVSSATQSGAGTARNAGENRTPPYRSVWRKQNSSIQVRWLWHWHRHLNLIELRQPRVELVLLAMLEETELQHTGLDFHNTIISFYTNYSVLKGIS